MLLNRRTPFSQHPFGMFRQEIWPSRQQSVSPPPRSSLSLRLAKFAFCPWRARRPLRSGGLFFSLFPFGRKVLVSLLGHSRLPPVPSQSFGTWRSRMTRKVLIFPFFLPVVCSPSMLVLHSFSFQSPQLPDNLLYFYRLYPFFILLSRLLS